jgi:AraC family transcriptional regulator of adaptative response / DNA-3-methyladenine glycosylase II
VSELSRRLGVSARHLDRLFSSHLGASPMAVVRIRRLNFAKGLISDTNLPMAVVAQAAGFGSVRRFNDSIRRLYGRTPTAIRRMRVPPLRAGQDEYVFRVAYRPPFDWRWLLAYLGERAIPGVEEVVSGAYRRTLEHEGRHGVVEVRHDERARALEVRLRFAHPLSLLQIVSRVRDMFDLSTDVSVVADHLGRDPLLAPLVRRYPAPRVPGAWDGFELAVGAILAREPAATGASLAGRIASEHGEPLSFADSGGLSALFPSARVLADARLAGIPPASAESIRALARAVNSGDVVLEPGESIGSLPDIPGIGEEIAEYVAMRALREPDAFPAGDLLLRRAAGRHEVLAAAALRERSERWRPWRAYAAVYLWRSTADATTDALPAGLTSARRAPDRDPRGESERKSHPRGGRHDRPRPVAGDYARA